MTETRRLRAALEVALAEYDQSPVNFDHQKYVKWAIVMENVRALLSEPQAAQGVDWKLKYDELRDWAEANGWLDKALRQLAAPPVLPAPPALEGQAHDWAMDEVLGGYRCRRCLVADHKPHGPICPKSIALTALPEGQKATSASSTQGVTATAQDDVTDRVVPSGEDSGRLSAAVSASQGARPKFTVTEPELHNERVDYQALYFELLYAVGNKHAGESRHQTALRYIRQAEETHGPASAAATPEADKGSGDEKTFTRVRDQHGATHSLTAANNEVE